MSTRVPYTTALENKLWVTQVIREIVEGRLRPPSSMSPEMRQRRMEEVVSAHAYAAIAQPFFISKTITALLQDAEASLPDNPLRREDLPCSFGFAFFEGMTDFDRHPEDNSRLETCGFAWGDVSEQTGKVHLIWYAFEPALAAAGGPVIPEPIYRLSLHVGETLQDWQDRQQADPQPRSHVETGLRVAKRLIGLWSFMQQRLCVKRRTAPDRPIKRRFDPGHWEEPPYIDVIELRNREYEHKPTGQEPKKVDWSCRWITRMHWRNQACGPGKSERKRILIAAHVRGPEDKPLKTSAKLFAVVR